MLGLHLKLSHISFPSSPPSFPPPRTRFTSSLHIYKVPVQRAGDSGGSPHVQAEAQRLMLHTCWLLQERSFQCTARLQGTLAGAAHSREVFLLHPGYVLSISPLDQAHLSPQQTSLLQNLFRHNLGGKGPCTNVLPLTVRHHRGKTQGGLLRQTSQHPPFHVVKVVEGKQKGWVEGRLCADHSGIWSWFNEGAKSFPALKSLWSPLWLNVSIPLRFQGNKYKYNMRLIVF